MGRSPGYIVMFATAVCLVCSVFVSGSYVQLKPQIEDNKVLDRQAKVLSVAGLVREGQQVSDKEIGELFEKNVQARVVNLETGEYNEEIDAATFDQRKAAKEDGKKAPANPAGVPEIPRHGLVYHVMKKGQIAMYVIPIEGKGLWGTMYGFIALGTDTRTIRGLTYYEHKETPGLGGEVDNPSWKALWDGRLAFDESWEPKIDVKKGAAGTPANDPYYVDGLSGATITSRSVGYMLRFWLGEHGYGPYLSKVRGKGKA